MRFFIALEIPKDSRKDIEEVQQRLLEIIPEARLTSIDKLHLTIAFIGDQDSNLIGSLATVLKSSTKDIPPFTVTPAYIDGFPTLHHTNIFWLGVKGDIDKLMVVRERVKDQLLNLNLPVDERRYIPHIAIAKVSNYHITDTQELALQELIKENLQPIKINTIKLFESTAQQDFHQHNTLVEVPLK